MFLIYKVIIKMNESAVVEDKDCFALKLFESRH